MKYKVDILIGGKPVRQFAHQNKVYIEGREGTVYEIRVKNDYTNRTEILCTVDGLDVLNGKAGCDTNRGYIVNGYSNVVIKGWRTSNDSVNIFKFAKKQKSYAAKHPDSEGDFSNCGVIGVRVFNEKLPPPPPKTIIEKHYHNYSTPNYWGQPWGQPNWNLGYWYSCGGGGTTTSAGTLTSGTNLSYSTFEDSTFADMIQTNTLRCCSANSFSLGTEFSTEKIEDKVNTVNFERGELAETIEIYYGTYDDLKAMGIDLYKEVSLPQSFPGNYCKPPC